MHSTKQSKRWVASASWQRPSGYARTWLATGACAAKYLLSDVSPSRRPPPALSRAMTCAQTSSAQPLQPTTTGWQMLRKDQKALTCAEDRLDMVLKADALRKKIRRTGVHRVEVLDGGAWRPVDEATRRVLSEAQGLLDRLLLDAMRPHRCCCSAPASREQSPRPSRSPK